ncbi:MAG: acyl-CoA dehydrogenase family protein [Acidimicrobiales bacterium]
MDFALSDQDVELAAATRDYARRVLRPAADRFESLESVDAFPWDLMAEGDALGLKALPLPTELGGRGADMVTQCLVAAELAAGDVGAAYFFRHYWRFARLIPRLPPAVRDIVVSGIAGDERFVPASASTEELAGSDNALPYDVPGHGAMLAARQEDDGSWVLDGTKTMITNGGIASLYFILARTDPTKGIRSGATMFAVPATAPGLSTGPLYRKLGQRGSPQADVVLDGCRVPADYAVSAVGEGYASTERGLIAANVTNAALSLGVAEAAYEEALGWSIDRVQGGVPIHRHQLVAHDLGWMRSQLDAARSFLLRVAWEYSHADQFDPGLTWSVRVFCADMSIEVAKRAMFLFGGRGMMVGYPVEKLLRDALTLTHGNGTTALLTARLGAHQAEARAAARSAPEAS